MRQKTYHICQTDSRGREVQPARIFLSDGREIDNNFETRRGAFEFAKLAGLKHRADYEVRASKGW